MNTLLIKFSKDWADEFQAEDFVICHSHLTTDQAMERISDRLALASENGEEFYFGTNEGYVAEEIGSGDFKVVEISEEMAAIIKLVLGTSFGTGIAQELSGFLEDE